jgi:class 3 adenylate cyclase
MKALIPLVFVCLILHSALAQQDGQPLADSLEKVLKQTDITDRERVDVLVCLMREYRDLMPRKAISIGEEAEKLAKEIHYEEKLGEIYLTLCYTYYFYNDVIKAYELALEALRYNMKYSVRDLIPVSQVSVLFNNPNADSNTKKDSLNVILKEVNSIKDRQWYIRTIGSLGNEFRNAGDLVKADSLIKLALRESRKYRMKSQEMISLSRMTFIYRNEKKYDSAINLLMIVNAYYDKIGKKRLYTENLITLADCYLHKYALEARNDFLDSAEKYINISLKISREIEYKINTLDNYYYAYFISRERGNLAKATGYLEQYIALNDSLYGRDSRKKLEGIAIRQRDEIARAQLLRKEAEVARQRIFTFAGLAGIVLTSLLLFLLYRNYRNQKQSNKIILQEKQRSEDLLLNILPEEIARELKSSGTSKAKAFTMVTVMFTDFKDFTRVSEKVSAELLVDEIHHCFSAFDNIIQKYKIEKIKTIGDAYMCASGLPVSTYTHATDMVRAALEIRNFMLARKKEKTERGEIPFDLRIGIHTGPVVAGIVGIKKYAYDIWGDTVNIAARMEQNSDAGKINISGSTYELVKEKFACTHRGKIEAKNKGMIDMYYLEEAL